MMASGLVWTGVESVLFVALFHLLTLPKMMDCLREPEVVCTNVDIRNRVENFKKLENCTVVEGYLQILLIDNGQPKDYDNVSFPQLTEISGYLLLYRAFGLTSVDKLFPNLAVIRGNILFHNYAFVVFEMYQLQEIGLSRLTDILRGSVRIEKNPSLCYVDTIDWDRIAKAGRGGHFIKANKKWDDCPNTCPENKRCPVVHRDGGKPLQLCWNSNHCQKTCSFDCERHNLTCSSETSKCCHQECLGGCTGSFSSECVACKHVVYNGRCMKKCPSNTYEYMNHRCVEEEECINYSKEYPYQGKVFWKPFQGQCVQECPTGYMEDKNNRHNCRNCTDRCPKVCPGVNVNNVAAAQGLHGCTYINGSLAIEIKGGYNVIKELEENLNMIQEINGYLKIARAYPLISLDFLKDLRVIHGSELHKQNYALLVLDNPNLQDLWDWKNKKSKLHIRGGKVFFHFNSKLCPSKISDLKKYAEVMEWDDRDVSPSSNGDRVACDVTNMNVSIPIIRSRLAEIHWQSFRSQLHDSRSLLGYVIYYREAPYNNVSIFEGRDACGADLWKVRDVEITEDSDQIRYIIYNLKPFTQYALYIRTYTTASGRQGAQSSIVYFKTKPDTPTLPLSIKARSPLHEEIVISWRPPKTPNGNVTHYIVEGIREVDSVHFINQRDYCLEPISVPAYKKVDEETTPRSVWFNATTTVSPSQSSPDCCQCDKSKTQLEDEEEDAEFQIHFEDFLHNNVYIKNPTAINTGRRRRSPILTPKPDEIKFNTPAAVTGTSMGSSSESSGEAKDNDVLEGNVLKQFRRSVYHHTFIVVSNLRHFTEYTIEVRACQDPSPDLKSDRCSSKAITTVRTSPLAGADDINSKSLTVQTVNVTARSGLVRWEEPKQPNGVIVAYYIEYKRLNIENSKAIQLCITQTTYLQYGKGYLITELTQGNYSIRVRAASLAGSGNWTQLVYFTVAAATGMWSPEMVVVIVIAVLVVVLILSGISFSIHKKYINRLPENIVYASVNPEYISAGLAYEPDEWEIPREKIKLIKELGQGSFGMVYEGEAYLEEGKPLIRCAAKTVNESASLRERIEFLQEASVMKAFNCHHVIKLLGVVSKGHPTLVIMELMANGDLKSYLRSHRPGEDNPDMQPPTVEQMFNMAAEISDGMAYLGAKKFVHRDLAARNCMVAEDMTVKIGDFGMTRDIYETDYYRKGGKGLLPVRWMAPESLQDGIFDCQSDVWSYGVVLWEMVTLASQPYQGLSNEQVLKYVIDGGKMDRPEDCPEKLYNIMTMCWDRNPKARPTFIEIIEILLSDVSETFRETSFYHTQRPGMSVQDIELTDAITPSTPLRSPINEETSPVASNSHNIDFRFFPSATQLPDESSCAVNGNHELQRIRHSSGMQASAADGSKGLSIYSNDSSKGMSLNYSDGSKGSKISNMSNGSIANGHVSVPSRRTANC